VRWKKFLESDGSVEEPVHHRGTEDTEAHRDGKELLFTALPFSVSSVPLW